MPNCGSFTGSAMLGQEAVRRAATRTKPVPTRRAKCGAFFWTRASPGAASETLNELQLGTVNPLLREPPIRDVSDTALWVASYRAMESERPDALFKDPYARRMAGKRGEDIVASIPWGKSMAWSIIVRTVVMDEVIHTAMSSTMTSLFQRMGLKGSLFQLTWVFAFQVIYYVLPLYTSGQTLGRKILKIQIVGEGKDGELTLGTACGRELLGKPISILALGLGFLPILQRKNRKAWHDHWFNTKVVSLEVE